MEHGTDIFIDLQFLFLYIQQQPLQFPVNVLSEGFDSNRTKRGRPRLHHPKVRLFEQKLNGKDKPPKCCKCNCINDLILQQKDLLFYRRMVHEPNTIRSRWEQICKFIKSRPDVDTRLKYTIMNKDVCQTCISWVLNVDRKTLM